MYNLLQSIIINKTHITLELYIIILECLELYNLHMIYMLYNRPQKNY